MQLRRVLALPVVHVLAVREDRILQSDHVEDAIPLVGDVDVLRLCGVPLRS
jgi:hypothetical protein